MYGEVDKIKLGRHCFQIGVIFCPKIMNVYSNKNPYGTAVGIVVVHFFIEFG